MTSTIIPGAGRGDGGDGESVLSIGGVAAGEASCLPPSAKARGRAAVGRADGDGRGLVPRYAAKVRRDRWVAGRRDDPAAGEGSSAARTQRDSPARRKAVLGITAFAFGLMIFGDPWSSVISGLASRRRLWHAHGGGRGAVLVRAGTEGFPQLAMLFISRVGAVGFVARDGARRNRAPDRAGAADMFGPAMVVLLAGGVSVIMTNTQDARHRAVLDGADGQRHRRPQLSSPSSRWRSTSPLGALIPSSSGHGALASRCRFAGRLRPGQPGDDDRLDHGPWRLISRRPASCWSGAWRSPRSANSTCVSCAAAAGNTVVLVLVVDRRRPTNETKCIGGLTFDARRAASSSPPPSPTSLPGGCPADSARRRAIPGPWSPPCPGGSPAAWCVSTRCRSAGAEIRPVRLVTVARGRPISTVSADRHKRAGAKRDQHVVSVHRRPSDRARRRWATRGAAWQLVARLTRRNEGRNAQQPNAAAGAAGRGANQSPGCANCGRGCGVRAQFDQAEALLKTADAQARQQQVNLARQSARLHAPVSDAAGIVTVRAGRSQAKSSALGMNSRVARAERRGFRRRRRLATAPPVAGTSRWLHDDLKVSRQGPGARSAARRSGDRYLRRARTASSTRPRVMRLGSTVTGRVVPGRTAGRCQPTALVRADGKTAVWVFDWARHGVAAHDRGAQRRRRVGRVAAGLKPGDGRHRRRAAAPWARKAWNARDPIVIGPNLSSGAEEALAGGLPPRRW